MNFLMIDFMGFLLTFSLLKKVETFWEIWKIILLCLQILKKGWKAFLFSFGSTLPLPIFKFSFQGILGMLSTINDSFFYKCYNPLGDLMDDIALMNSSINFIVYYLMSKQFRKTFLETFGLVWDLQTTFQTQKDQSII